MKTEPAADLRQMAVMLHQMYVALTDEGFTEAQALTLLGQVIAAGMSLSQPGEGEG